MSLFNLVSLFLEEAVSMGIYHLFYRTLFVTISLFFTLVHSKGFHSLSWSSNANSKSISVFQCGFHLHLNFLNGSVLQPYYCLLNRHLKRCFEALRPIYRLLTIYPVDQVMFICNLVKQFGIDPKFNIELLGLTKLTRLRSLRKVAGSLNLMYYD